MDSIHYSEPRLETSLTEALTRRARAASSRRLAIDVVAGVLLADSVLFWRPRAWILFVSAALPFVAFGLWGFADRGLHEVSATPRRTFTSGLLLLRYAALTLGALSALVLLFGGVGMAMGTWIE